MKDKDKVKSDILMAMYRSVDRQNHHILKCNLGSAESEKWLQVNLRKDFEHIS